MVKVFLDLDYSFENIIALEYALKNKDIEVVGISTVHGKYKSVFAYRKYLAMLKSMNKDIPLFCGANLPYCGQRGFVENFSHDFSLSTNNISKEIYELIKDDEVTYLSLGSVTNLYYLLSCYDLKANLRIIAAAGSFAFGTITACSEHRVYFDAEAFDELIDLGYDFTLLPLDCCKDYIVSPFYLDNMDLKKFCKEIRFHEREESIFKRNTMRSLLAVRYAIDNSLFKVEKYKCRIEKNSSLTHGMSVIYKNNFDGIFKNEKGDYCWTTVKQEDKNIKYIEKVDELIINELDDNFITINDIEHNEKVYVQKNKPKVILDVDTGIDDSIAIFCALMSKKIDVVGITCSYGNTTLNNVVKNTYNAVKATGKNIPIGIGAAKPWRKTLRTSPFIHGESGIGTYEYPYDDENNCYENAWDLMSRLIRDNDDKITIVALGPCTNVGNLIHKYPFIINRIERIIYMGGEIRGDTAGSQVASVNIFHDPEAAKYVIESPVNFHMCTSSFVTDHVTLSFNEIKNSIQGESVVSKASREMLYHYFKTCDAVGQNENSRLALHDPATLMYLIEPECYTYEETFCQVDIEGLETYGYTLIDYLDIERRKRKNMNLVRIDRSKCEFIKNEILKLLSEYN